MLNIRSRDCFSRRRRWAHAIQTTLSAGVLAAWLGAEVALAAPVVSSTSPVDQAVGAPLSSNITIRFAAPLDPVTVTSANVLLTSSQQGTHAKSVTWNAGSLEIRIDPTKDFLPGERVTVTLGKGIRDALAVPFPNGWHFEFSTWTAAVPTSGFATSSSTWSIGSIAFCLSVSDLTGDGLPEAVFSNVVPDSLTILTPNGVGGFSLLAHIGRPDATLPRHVAIGDLDSDGKPDLVCCASGPSQIQVFRNLGGGAFAAPAIYGTGQTPYGAYLGDLDADGDLDVATANFNAHSVSVLKNVGGGVLAPSVDFPAGPGSDSPRCVDGADLDLDGDIDLVCSNGYSNNLSVFLNNGSGVLTVQLPLYSVGEGPQYLELRDVTGDHIPDAITVNSLSETISVLRGNGNGTFQPQISTSVAGEFPYGLQTVDIDGDLDLDMVLPIRGASAWQIVRNDGLGNLVAEGLHFGGMHCHTVGAADWDRDGDIDVIAGFAITQNMYYYAQMQAPAVLAISPPRNATGAAIDAPLQVTFSLDLAPSSVADTAFVVHGSQSGSHTVAVAWSSADHKLTLSPAQPFFPGETVTLVIEAGLLKSTGGVPFPGDVAQFMTAGAPSPGALVAGAPVEFSSADPVDIAAADFDRDGRSDLAVSNLLSGSVSLLLTAGSPIPVLAGSVAAGAMPIALLAADLDGDGDPDLATANLGSSTLGILLDANGVFTPATPVALGAAPFSVGAGDLDRDGDIDLFAAMVTPAGVRVLLNQGPAVFSLGTFLPTPVPPTDIAVADLDRDGNLDVAAVLAQLDRVEVFLFGPTGLRSTTGFATGDIPMGISAWDANGDGSVDLLCSAYGAATVSVLSNTGNGAFSPPVGLPAGSLPRGVWSGDLTGDGAIDVVATNSGAGSVSVFRSLGGGSFAAPQVLATGTTPYAVAGGDFDGNGRVDLAIVNRTGGDLSFVWNGAPTGAIADLESQPSGFLGAWPNPFSASVSIRLAVPTASIAFLDVYDVAGRSVARLLAKEPTQPGPRTVVWNGRNKAGRRVGSGVYFLRLEAGGRQWTHRVLRVR